MIATLPGIHASLLSISAVGAVAFGGLILARYPGSTPARLHFVYAATVAWWFVCAAMMATAETTSTVQYWARLAQLSLGMLPGVIYHVSTAHAGLAELYRRRIRAHWLFSVALTLFALTWPSLLTAPTVYAWGPYQTYTPWGSVVALSVLVVLVEVAIGYRIALARSDPRSARHLKARAFYRGMLFASLALVDFLPAFGVPVYPFGYVVLTIMQAVILYGTVRYRLIEITPEFATEHILSEMPDGLLVIDTQGMIQLANGPAAEALGCSVEQLIGEDVGAEGQHPDVAELLKRVDAEGETQEISYVDAVGQRRHLRGSASTIKDQVSFPVARICLLHDITSERIAEGEREALEESVRTKHRFESLGAMAGGVAHDFNNLLLGILGNAELASEKADDAHAVRAYVERIASTAERASDLTKQMLTYAGDTHSHRERVDLNESVADVSELMTAAICKKTDLNQELHPALPAMFGDPGQLSQVILNLITNASESLGGDPGVITLRTGVTRPDDSFVSLQDAASDRHAGEHVFLEVTDTGVGMDRETLRRMFDPFFTTKFTGRGLGLATLAGVLRAHSGLTRVKSQPGRGTTFTVAFPVAPQSREQRSVPLLSNGAWQGRGLVLLADDEPGVREVANAMLTRAGFSVIDASDGEEAAVIFESRSEDFALVVLDQTMPGLSGKEAFARIRAASSDVPVVFMSGYSEAPIGALDEHTTFLQKPFRASMLLAKVREAMGVQPPVECRSA